MHITPGPYRHYKGGVYDVLFIATLEATQEQLVIYRSRSKDQTIWARPAPVFTEEVLVNGIATARFTKIE